ncbi:MAG: AAA family ATPase [Bacteroidota bacterium]
MLAPLPIGLQDFRSIRERGFLYVDKTEAIHRLVRNGTYFFLSRPRRFGKSLTLSTIKELYVGSEDLFQGLWIHDHWDWQRSHPVIHLPFNSIGYAKKGLEKALADFLEKEANRHDLSLRETYASSMLLELIEKLHQAHGERVVLLIDEYDKPIIDYLEDPAKAKAQRDELKTFYGGLKGMDPHVEFAFITGVSKFSRMSIFSELNNLNDLTLHPRYTTLMGYTQQELNRYFSPYLAQIGEQRSTPQAELRESVQRWYNGYSWDGKHFVYNPFSILSFMDAGQFQNFWFSTGTPTFLIKLFRNRMEYAIGVKEVGQAAFEAFDLDHIDTTTLLFQTGYLTIKEAQEFGTFLLDYPNQEVKDSLLQYLIGTFGHISPTASTPLILKVRKAFLAEDIPQVMLILNGLFKSIPSHLFLKDREAYYHSLVFLAFQYLGVYLEAEVHTFDGRIDAVVYTEKQIYLLEFKLDQTAEKALAQIQQKAYPDRFRADGRRLMAVGVNFSSEKKAIDDWRIEQL